MVEGSWPGMACAAFRPLACFFKAFTEGGGLSPCCGWYGGGWYGGGWYGDGWYGGAAGTAVAGAAVAATGMGMMTGGAAGGGAVGSMVALLLRLRRPWLLVSCL